MTETKKLTKSQEQATRIETLEKEVENIKLCLEKVATLQGCGNHLQEFGLERWHPTKQDMVKYK